jgi:acetoacetyl-CoA synthetase
LFKLTTRLFQSEIVPLTEISWQALYQQVTSVATALRDLGVKPGDRVVAYMPNIPQTLVAFLACAGIGAVWSSCSPDFGTRSVIDRFNQIGPRVLFAVDGYSYGGKSFDLRPAVGRLQRSLATLEKTVLVPYLKPDAQPDGLDKVVKWDDILLKENREFIFERAVGSGSPGEDDFFRNQCGLSDRMYAGRTGAGGEI